MGWFDWVAPTVKWVRVDATDFIGDAARWVKNDSVKWVKKDAVPWVKKTADNVYTPFDNTLKRISSTTLDFTNEHPYTTYYVLVQPNYQWQIADTIALAPTMPTGIGTAGVLWKLNSTGEYRGYQLAMNSLLTGDNRFSNYGHRVWLEQEKAARFKAIKPGQSLTLQEKATIRVGRITPSGLAGTVSLDFKNEWVAIISEGGRTHTTFCTNEDEKWVIREDGVHRVFGEHQRTIDRKETFHKFFESV